MLTITRNRLLPTTMTGSYPKPHWHTLDLQGRPFKQAMGHTPFREQYLDAVAAVIAEQGAAGLDIVKDYTRSCEAVAGSQPADLSRISCPLLLIAVEDDKVGPPQISRSLAQSLPRARVTVLWASGHWLPIERPREVT